MADNRIMVTLPYTVDLDRCPVEQHLPMSFGTGDKEAHKIIMTAYRATGIVDLSGAGVICYVNRADKSTVVVDSHVEDGKAVIVLPEECYAINGSVSIVVKLTLDETRTTVLWLIGSVNRTSNGKLVDPGNVVPSLEELLAQIAEMEEATEKANTAAESAQVAASAAYTAAETSSPPVVLSGEGKAVTLDGAAEGRRLVGLRVFGASVQAAAPAPDAPVDVSSVTEPVVTLTGTDGAVQTLTVAGVTLRGVQVTGDADYTDADGAKWVADEVDFGRGVLVSRIGVRVFDGTESWTAYGVTTGTYRAWQGSYSKLTERVDRGAVMTHYPVLANYADLYYGRVVGAYAGGAGMDMGRIILCGDYASAEDLKAYLAAQHAAGTPLTVYYVLREPVETALTAEQLAGFAALRVGADMTVSSGAWVRAEYVGDTKGYIDRAAAHVPEADHAADADTVRGVDVVSEVNGIGEALCQIKNEKADKATIYAKEDVDRIVGSMFYGGKNYYTIMKAYFEANGCAIRTDLTNIVEGWYKLGRFGWTGGTTFLNPDQSSLSTGTKVGDNAGMTCTPSTNTVAGQDDYALLPLFAVVDCNWELGSGGKRIITAVDGITSANPFVRNDPTRPVGVLQMAPWMKYEEDDTSYTYWMSDQEGKEGFYPIPESVDLDGTVHSWVVHAKYGLGDDLSSISGVPIRVWDISHNSQRTMIPQKFNENSYYCGKCSCDDAWMKLHVYIKYASLTLDDIMNGCCSYYNSNVHPAVAETGVKRVIVTTSQGNGLLVGSTMCLGSSTYGGKSTQCSVVDRAKITSIEDVTIDGTAYKAVYLDVANTFDTTVDQFWSTMQWHTGSTDAVLGNDGSPYNNKSSKEPYKLQGIEQSYGCYEIIADMIFAYASLDGANVLTYNVCRNATQFATSVTSNYKKASYVMPCPASAGLNYIKRLGHDPSMQEIMAPCVGGGSSSTFTRDGMYMLAQNSGNYEWRALGHLGSGLTYAGLSCAVAGYGLTYANWNIGGRLSANGSRGEYAA